VTLLLATSLAACGPRHALDEQASAGESSDVQEAEGGAETEGLTEDAAGRYVYVDLADYRLDRIAWPSDPWVSLNPLAYTVRDPDHARSGIWRFDP
jgi:hypothetical protein